MDTTLISGNWSMLLTWTVHDFFLSKFSEIRTCIVLFQNLVHALVLWCTTFIFKGCTTAVMTLPKEVMNGLLVNCYNTPLTKGASVPQEAPLQDSKYIRICFQIRIHNATNERSHCIELVNFWSSGTIIHFNWPILIWFFIFAHIIENTITLLLTCMWR